LFPAYTYQFTPSFTGSTEINRPISASYHLAEK
jgi:hypothetical protein